MGVCRKLKTISLCTAGGGNSIYSHINQAEEHNFLNQNEDEDNLQLACLQTLSKVFFGKVILEKIAKRKKKKRTQGDSIQRRTDRATLVNKLLTRQNTINLKHAHFYCS